jgi:hypothetical protein
MTSIEKILREFPDAEIRIINLGRSFLTDKEGNEYLTNRIWVQVTLHRTTVKEGSGPLEYADWAKGDTETPWDQVEDILLAIFKLMKEDKANRKRAEWLASHS